MRKVIWVFFILIISQCSFAQQPWNRVINLPQENAINDIARIPGTETIVAVCEGSTLMISYDLGNSWNVKCNPAGLDNYTNLKSVFFTNASQGFITTENGLILKTLDGGNQWNIVHVNSSGDALNDIYFVSATHGITCGNNGLILKTINGGNDWNEVSSGVTTDLKEIKFVTALNGVILSTSTEYLLATIDGGNTWAASVFNPPLQITQMLSLDFVNETTGYLYGNHSDMMGMIYKTTDGGNTWVLNFQADDMYTGRIAFSGTQVGIVLYGSHMYESKIYYTLNGGVSWTSSTLPGYSMRADRALFFYDAETAFIGGNKGFMFRTDNHGVSWIPLHQKVFKGQVVQVQFVGEGIGYISFLNELYGVIFWEMHKTFNGGVTWVEMNSIDVFELPPAFHFPDANTGYVVFGWGSTFMAKTLDGGGTWVFSHVADGIMPFDVRFQDSETGYIACSSNILKTVDGGENWTIAHIGYDDYIRILFQSTEDIVVIGEYSIVFSNDGGSTWTERGISNATPVSDAFIKDDGKIFITFGQLILWTDDYGLTWNQAAQNTPNPMLLNSIFFSSQSTGIAVGAGPYETALKTIDGGLTWNAVDIPATSALTCVWFFDDLHGYVFGEKGLAMETFSGGVTGITNPGILTRNLQAQAFPNPFSETLNIDIGNGWTGEPSKVLIYDVMGKLVFKQALMNRNQVLNLSGLKSGVYIYQVVNEKGSSLPGKLIKK